MRVGMYQLAIGLASFNANYVEAIQIKQEMAEHELHQSQSVMLS